MRPPTMPEDMLPDYTIGAHWVQYSDDDHRIWHELNERQQGILQNRACKEYWDGVHALGLDTRCIPDLRRVSGVLEKRTGWQLVIAPGMVPKTIFLEHLAHRRFPVTWWIRGRDEMDYLKEPDIFHDLFGHVPMLCEPVFADYIEQFGKGALKAQKLGSHKFISKLYWFTVEFGLINTQEGLRIYGSGIVSSASESVYALESPRPRRLKFDLLRMMRTRYKYDDLQKTYFVIDSFQELFDKTAPDFTDYYTLLKTLPEIGEDETVAGDRAVQYPLS